MPQKEPLIQHDIGNRPWSKVGTDIFHNETDNYLIVIYYCSNFVEVFKLVENTSKEVVNKLREIFSRFGVPDVVMSDNRPHFNSKCFAEFARK